MTDWLPQLHALAVPVVLAVSLLMLVVADLLLAGPSTPDHDAQPGASQGKGPVSFREMRDRRSGKVTAQRNPFSRSQQAGHSLALPMTKALALVLPQGSVLPLTPVATADGAVAPAGMLLRESLTAPLPAAGSSGTAATSAANPGSVKDILAWIALAQLLGCLALTFFVAGPVAPAGAAFVDDALAVFVQRVSLCAGILGVLGSMAHVKQHFPRRQGEFWALLMASVLGMTLIAGAQDLLLLAVAVELMGLPLVALCAYARTDVLPGSPRGTPPQTAGAEAGLKLYLVGAASTAISLYGLSLLYGIAGGTRLSDLAAAPASLLLPMAVGLLLAGFGFKLGLAPFQLWIPDTYQGAPTPVVAFLSVAPKVAGLTVLLRVLLDGLPAHAATWVPPLVVLAVATMAAGNLLALPQSNLKRLLGNSGVAQVGTILLGLIAAGTVAKGGPNEGAAAVLFYALAYLGANTALFLVLETLGTDTMASLRGLHRRSPALALVALVSLLSLAGIPFAVGFWAKLYVMLAAWQAGYAWLVLVAAGLAVLGLFYYLRMARAMYLGEPEDPSPVRVGRPMALALALSAAATVGMGLWPKPWIEAAGLAAAVLR